jgi:hypothetical protein
MFFFHSLVTVFSVRIKKSQKLYNSCYAFLIFNIQTTIQRQEKKTSFSITVALSSRSLLRKGITTVHTAHNDFDLC